MSACAKDGKRGIDSRLGKETTGPWENAEFF